QELFAVPPRQCLDRLPPGATIALSSLLRCPGGWPMSAPLTCPRGHQWQTPGPDPTQTTRPVPVCPVCGAAPVSPSAGSAAAVDVTAATVAPGPPPADRTARTPTGPSTSLPTAALDVRT